MIQGSSISTSVRGPAEAGEEVLASAVELARMSWGNRLVAAYALGSLAHGGFSIHVSDVDFGLLLSDPLGERDKDAVDRLSSAVKAGGTPLSDRLSIFWGSPGTLSRTPSDGRFPAVDLLDLIQYGRLLYGRDLRAQFRAPTRRELIVSGARFALRRLSNDEVTPQLKHPDRLARAGVKTLTKLVLFPVRLLFTARTGQVGMNHEAVEHFLRVEGGPAAELAQMSIEWRSKPPQSGDHAVAALLQQGMRPLYWTFIKDYEERLREYDERELAQAYHDWRRQLA